MIAENLLSLQTDPCVIFLSLLTLLQSLNSVCMNLTRQLDEELSDMETTAPNLVNTFQNPLNVHLALSHILTLVTMNHDDENERINLLATQHNTRYEDYQKVKKIWKQREEDLEKELGGLTTYKDWCSRNMSLFEQEIRKCNETASRLHTTAEKYDDLKNEVSKYKTDIALVSLNLSHCELREETLRNERAEAKKKLEDSESDVALLQQDLQDERKSLAEEMKKCSEMKANYTNEVEKLDTLLRDKTKNSTNLLKSVNDLTEQIENLKRDLKSEQAKLLKTSKDLQDKESQVKEFSTFLENEKCKVNNLTQNIKAVRENCSNEITAINLQLHNKEKELQKEKINFTKLQTQTVQLEAKVNQTEKELETEKNNSSSLEKSLNRTAERAGRYTDLHRQCSKRLSNYMGETRNLNIKLHLAEKELQDKKSEVAKCKEKLKETKMSLEEYKEEMFELNALRKENKEYEKQLGAERLQLDDIVLQSWKLLSQAKTMSCASCNLERELKHINVTKDMALLAAVRKGDLEVAEQTVDFNTDLNIRSNNGYTLLHWAATKGHASIAKMLLENGASIIATTTLERYTPLHLAAAAGSVEICSLLLSKHAPINVVDNYKFAPLHWAVIEEHLEVVKLLLKHKANKDMKDVYERGPMDLTTNADIIKELKRG